MRGSSVTVSWSQRTRHSLAGPKRRARQAETAGLVNARRTADRDRSRDRRIDPMNHRGFARVLLEALAAALSLVAAVITALVPDWLERTFGVHPDAGRGEAEWLVVGTFFIVAVLLGLDVGGALRRMSRSRSQSTARKVITGGDVAKWRKNG
jgi:hypothetical protein